VLRLTRPAAVAGYRWQPPGRPVALGNSAGTVKSQTSRALGRLRAYLAADLRPVTTQKECTRPIRRTSRPATARSPRRPGSA